MNGVAGAAEHTSWLRVLLLIKKNFSAKVNRDLY